MVECAGLEIQCTFRRTVSSNLTLSARNSGNSVKNKAPLEGLLFFSDGDFRSVRATAKLAINTEVKRLVERELHYAGDFPTSYRFA